MISFLFLNQKLFKKKGATTNMGTPSLEDYFLEVNAGWNV
jgi:hypothetical protein